MAKVLLQLNALLAEGSVPGRLQISLIHIVVASWASHGAGARSSADSTSRAAEHHVGQGTSTAFVLSPGEVQGRHLQVVDYTDTHRTWYLIHRDLRLASELQSKFIWLLHGG